MHCMRCFNVDMKWQREKMQCQTDCSELIHTDFQLHTYTKEERNPQNKNSQTLKEKCT